jgi:hypothetical protein
MARKCGRGRLHWLKAQGMNKYNMKTKNPSEQRTGQVNTEGQEWKTGHAKGWV